MQNKQMHPDSEIRFYGPLGEYGFLSNHYRAPFELDDRLWPTVEHYFQAAKTANVVERERIRSLSSPGKARAAGRALNLPCDWDEAK